MPDGRMLEEAEERSRPPIPPAPVSDELQDWTQRPFPLELTVPHVVALQRSAGNAAVQRALVRHPMVHATAPVLARAPHRPKARAKIEWNKKTWDVLESNEHSDYIKIKSGKEQKEINWRDTEFWIIREPGESDFDLRQRTAPAEAAEVRRRFDEAKEKALEMIKAYAKPKVQKQAERELMGLALTGLNVTKRGVATDGGNDEAEWSLDWPEGDKSRPRRMWHFKVDSDDPPPESDQEPHVGWEARADAVNMKGGDVERKLGHIWLNQVPVSRGAF